MGLDMYAWRVPGGASNAKLKDVDQKLHGAGAPPDRIDKDSVAVAAGEGELHYWRKHPNLHGWMQALYREKGGADPNFNCNTLRLTLADLDRLEADLRGEKLPETTGFFFGYSCGSEIDGDLQFLAKARSAIEAGDAVYYVGDW